MGAKDTQRCTLEGPHLKTTHNPTHTSCFIHWLPIRSDSGQTTSEIFFALPVLLRFLTSQFSRVQPRPTSLTSSSLGAAEPTFSRSCAVLAQFLVFHRVFLTCFPFTLFLPHKSANPFPHSPIYSMFLLHQQLYGQNFLRL